MKGWSKGIRSSVMPGEVIIKEAPISGAVKGIKDMQGATEGYSDTINGLQEGIIACSDRPARQHNRSSTAAEKGRKSMLGRGIRTMDALRKIYQQRPLI